MRRLETPAEGRLRRSVYSVGKSHSKSVLGNVRTQSRSSPDPMTTVLAAALLLFPLSHCARPQRRRDPALNGRAPTIRLQKSHP